ncbi:hypothetical protein LEP1GSC050_4217 [Leptospira broomii serovar Hurstbridge str. 5399]|uniref:Uncharacterized protein n=1 Tax=Leptospira broomii serovar Hurstbridge str. 5399 TaxID=1049789 RepID=T0F4D2_9LEPT|nr:hypothetical protein [Leptospira broomii]EQA45965.1 hypothetical protein LEP1GSC050_4217 [Leptospira broomii serovar Hurstbridge str. 5399]
MPTSFRPYYIDANDQKVILTTDASVIQATAALIAQFPQIATIGQESIRTNLVTPLAQGNVSPLPFLQLAFAAYASIQGDENLPDGDATTKLRLDFSAGDPCTIKITASLPDPTLRLAQLQYVFTLSDQIMNFFSFEVVNSAGENLVYGASKDAVLDYLVIFNLLSAYTLSTDQNLIRKISRQNSEFAKGLQRFVNFSDFSGAATKYTEFTITRTIANVLFVDRAKPSDWYPVRLEDNTVLDRINLIAIKSSGLTKQGKAKLQTTIFFSKGGNYLRALSTIDIINSEEFSSDKIPSEISRIPDDASPLTNRRVYYYNAGGNLLAYLGEYIPETSGGVGGRGRADSPDENEFLWTGSFPTGYAIGLPLKNHLGLSRISLSGFFMTNTPVEKFFTMGRSKSTSSIALAATYPLLEELGYYKKQNMGVPRKNLPKEYKKPKVFSNVPPQKNFKYIGENPNQLLLYRKIMKGEIAPDTKETKGLPLQHSESQERENAGSVMKKYLFSTKFSGGMDVDGADTFSAKFTAYYAKRYPTPFQGSSLSATDFTNYTVSEDGQTTDAIQKFPTDVPYLLKTDPYYQVETDQEWCHLFGHGDGGPDIPKNFVSGSKHCNTEQLAIETGQRKRKIAGLTAKITAYLLPASDIWFNPDPDAGTGAEVKSVKDSLPLAHVMRYKVYDAKKNKVFDHWYDAQAQSFDYNEFLILEEFVDRKTSIGDDAGRLEYRGSLIARFLDRLFKDCKTNDIPYGDVALKPFYDFPSGYKNAKSKKTDRQNTVVQFLEGDGKPVLEQFIFEEKLSLLATKSLPPDVQHLFSRVIDKSLQP